MPSIHRIYFCPDARVGPDASATCLGGATGRGPKLSPFPWGPAWSSRGQRWPSPPRTTPAGHRPAGCQLLQRLSHQPRSGSGAADHHKMAADGNQIMLPPASLTASMLCWRYSLTQLPLHQCQALKALPRCPCDPAAGKRRIVTRRVKISFPRASLTIRAVSPRSSEAPAPNTPVCCTCAPGGYSPVASTARIWGPQTIWMHCFIASRSPSPTCWRLGASEGPAGSRVIQESNDRFSLQSEWQSSCAAVNTKKRQTERQNSAGDADFERRSHNHCTASCSAAAPICLEVPTKSTPSLRRIFTATRRPSISTSTCTKLQASFASRCTLSCVEPISHC